MFLKNSCDLWNSTLVVVEVFNYNQCTVPEITTILQDLTNSMRNLHKYMFYLKIPSNHRDIRSKRLYVTLTFWH